MNPSHPKHSLGSQTCRSLIAGCHLPMDQPGQGECWHTCSQPCMNTPPGHPMHSSAHTDQARLYSSHQGSSWNGCGSESEFGSGWSRAPAPFSVAKSKHSVCVLPASLYLDSTPTRELFATNTGILAASAELSFLLSSLPAPCWTCPCHTASCFLLQGCFHSYTAAQRLHVK